MPRFVYTCILFLMLPFMPIKLLWRGLKQRAYLKHWGERFGFYKLAPNKPVIWLHCVSVGETRAAEPLVKLLFKKYPQHQVLITNTTPTGRDTSEQLFKDSVLRVYLPYDVPFAVNRFIKHFKPSIGMLMETELWFNLIAACKKNNVPLVLLNARLSEKSAKGYEKLGKLVSDGLQSLSLIATQSTQDELRLKLLGANNTIVSGNLKFDVDPPAEAQAEGVALRALLGPKRIVFLASSTREDEEGMILDAVDGLDILTVIVPRHPERFDEVEVLLTTRDIPYQVRADLTQPVPANIRVVLGNTMGELFTYYAACDFTLVGGSLKKYGGQNLIEAASMGKPILIGKYTYNFAEASKSAVKMGAAVQVKDIKDLRHKIEVLINNPDACKKMGVAALNFSKASSGATIRVFKAIEEFLPATN